MRKVTRAQKRNAWADRDELLHRCRGPRRNHLCRFVLRSLTGFGRGGWSNFGFLHWLASSPLQHSRTTVRVCDTVIERDIGQKSSFYHTPLAFDAPVRRVPVRIAPPRLVRKKTRMAWLLDGEKISKISLFVLAQLTNVTDTQTDTGCRHIPRLCIESRGKNRPILIKFGTLSQRYGRWQSRDQKLKFLKFKMAAVTWKYAFWP